jgi:hypothetical protein
MLMCLSALCAACVSTPSGYSGYYNRASYVYANPDAGFRLVLPPPWTLRTAPQTFTVPTQLRPDQEQVLEAYHPASGLGLIIVVQQGPVLEIADLVQQMQATDEEQLATHLRRPDVTAFQQLSVRKMVLNGHEMAEWIYMVTDATGAQPIDMTVSYYIAKVRAQYVYLTFSIPATRYPETRPSIESTLATFALL